MPTDASLKLQATGADSMAKDLAAIAQRSKTLNAEMTALGKGFEDATLGQTNYERKSNLLNQQIENQKKLISALEEELKKSEKANGENSKKTEEWRTKIANANAALAGMQKDLDNLNDEEDEYSRNTEDATKKTSIFGDVLKANLVGTAITNGLKSIAQGIKNVAKATVEGFTSSVKWADDIEALSAQTSISTQTLQEWQYMAGLVDVEVETLTSANTKLVKAMSSAQSGSKSQTEAFEKLGVSVTNADGSLRNAESVMYEVFGALGQVGNETERDALSMQIFGKSARDLNPLIETGTDTLKAFAEEAHNTGYVLDEEAIGALTRTQDAMDRISASADGLKRNLSAEFAPVVASAMETALPHIQAFGQGIAGVFSGKVRIADFTTQIIAGLQGLVSQFQDHKNEIVQQGTDFVQALTDGITIALPQLIDMAVPLVTSFAESLVDAGNIEKVVDSAIKIILALVNGLVSALPQLIKMVPEIVKQIVVGIVKNLPQIIATGNEIPLAIIEGILRAIGELISIGFEMGVKIVENFEKTDWKELGTQVINGLISGVKSMLSRLWNTITDVANGIVTRAKKALGIASPSKKFAEIGRFAALGYGIGFEKEMQEVADRMEFGIPEAFGSYGSGSYRQTNLGGVNITVYGAEGQSIDGLADAVMLRMNTAVRQRQGVFA